MLQCVAMCYSVLQRVAVCCSVLQMLHAALGGAFGKAFQREMTSIEFIAVRWGVLGCVGVCCILLQCVAVR